MLSLLTLSSFSTMGHTCFSVTEGIYHNGYHQDHVGWGQGFNLRRYFPLLALEVGKVLNRTKYKRGNQYIYLVIPNAGCWKDEPQLTSEVVVFCLQKLSSITRSLSSLHDSLAP